MVSTQLHLGQREPDKIHMHWQILMKEVYGNGIWRPRNKCITSMGSIWGWYMGTKAVVTLKWICSVWGQYTGTKAHWLIQRICGDSIWGQHHIQQMA